MALKDIFTMVKADRYTADGREELIEAHESETEDRRYNIGEISQKTGLQKTANGWVKPKNGKQTGAKENGPLSPAKRKAERIAKMQKETGKAAPYGRTLKGTPKTPDDNPLTERTQKRAEESKPAAEGWEETRMASGKIYDLKSQGKRIIEQYDPETEIKTFKLRDLNNSRTPDKEFKSLEEAKTAATKSAESKPTTEPTSSQEDLLKKKRQWDMEGGPANETERAEYDKLKSQIKYKLPDEKSSFSTDVNRMKKLKAQDPREFSAQLEKLHSKYSSDKWQSLYNKTLQDAAPRVLTGDTRIRVRK